MTSRAYKEVPLTITGLPLTATVKCSKLGKGQIGDVLTDIGEISVIVVLVYVSGTYNVMLNVLQQEQYPGI